MSKFGQTRRAFLKGVAATSIPMILPSSLFGQNAPSKRVNLALIGSGGRGNALVGDFINQPAAQFLAVCDCFIDRRERMRTQMDQHYGGSVVQSYADFREVLARGDIDAVIVATPDHWHVPIALAAARAGKDMYVEKPLGVAMTWAWKLRDELKRTKRIFQYGTQQRSWAQFHQACELARNGYLGKIERVDAWCPDMSTQYARFSVPQYGSTVPIPVPEGLDYERWIGPAPMSPYTADRCTSFGTYHHYDNSLGFVAGWGAHPLDIMQWGLDTDKTGPVRYEGTGVVPDKGLYRTLDSWDMECTYKNGIKVHFMGNRVAEPVVSAYRAWGDHGTTFFGDEGWVSVDRGGICASDPKLLEITLKRRDTHLTKQDSHAGGFLDCVLKRKATISPFEAALRSDTISHLTNIAIRTGGSLDWDPKKERILNNEKASEMLDRPVSAPWDLDGPMLS